MFGFGHEESYANLKIIRKHTFVGVGDWRIEIGQEIFEKYLEKEIRKYGEDKGKFVEEEKEGDEEEKEEGGGEEKEEISTSIFQPQFFNFNFSKNIFPLYCMSNEGLSG